MSKHKPTIKTTIKSIDTVSLSRTFFRQFSWKLLSKDLWQSLYLLKFYAFSIFFWIPSDGCVWCMRIILWDASYFRYLNSIHTLQKPHCKKLLMKYNKNESFKPYLGNKKQKFLIASGCFSMRFAHWVCWVWFWAHVFFFLFSCFCFCFYFACPMGRANEIARSKNRVRRKKFVQPWLVFS